MSAVEELARELRSLKRSVRALQRSESLANSSFEGGAVQQYDLAGQLLSRFGDQHDGTNGVANLVGPTPPTPAGVTAETAPGGILVKWQGEFVPLPLTDPNVAPTPVVAPLDFLLAEVHVSVDPGFDARLAVSKRQEIVSARGGEAFVPVGPGVSCYVRLVVRSMPGKFSEPSALVGPVAGGGIEADMSNSTIPAAPTWDLPFLMSVYQSPATGSTRAQVELALNQPVNLDGSAITDGAYYEVRYRTTSAALRPATHAQLAVFTHTQLAAGTHQKPLPYTVSAWQYARFPFGLTELLLQELTAGATYEAEVRAVDNGIPANASAWSATESFTTPVDRSGPDEPAPPVVAGNRLALMVRHNLGRADGGTFNLPLDLSHLEVHAEYEPTFQTISLPPNEGGTMLGKLVAGQALITGRLPAIGSFGIENTGAMYVKVVAVDLSGNKSSASQPVQATAQLIDAAHISTIFAESIVSGKVLAQLILGGSIATPGTTGARVGFDVNGFYAYDAANNLFFEVNKNSATVRGNLQLGPDTGPKIAMTTADQAIRFFPLAGSPQRIKISAYAVDQPEDPADAPGLDISTYDENLLATGGQISLSEDWLTIGVRKQPAGGVGGDWAAYHSMGSNGEHRFRGTFAKSDAAGGQGALFVNSWSISAGFGAGTVTYGATMASPVVTQATMLDTAGIINWTITSSTLTSFTVSYSGARAVYILYMSMRIPA